MGFFSWKCAKTQKPIMAECAVKGSPWLFASRVTVLFEDGSVLKGVYDGYGRVENSRAAFELTDIDQSQWRMVISEYYDSEPFHTFSLNKHDQGQGFFYNDEELETVFK